MIIANNLSRAYSENVTDVCLPASDLLKPRKYERLSERLQFMYGLSATLSATRLKPISAINGLSIICLAS